MAGDGTGVTSLGSPATNTGFSPPDTIAVDAAGNIVFSNRTSASAPVLRVNTAGVLELVAGSLSLNGNIGNTGDGGLATAATVGIVRGITFDSSGNLLFLSSDRIRRVNSAGIVSTAFGGALNDGGTSTNARVMPNGSVYALASDAAGNLLVIDIDSRIRRISAGNITTFAGNGLSNVGNPPPDGTSIGSFALNSPVDLTYAPSGELYFSDYNRIFRVSSTGSVSAIAGNGTFGYAGDNGPATAASIAVSSLAVDAAGNVFFTSANRIRRVTPGGTISTIAGNDTSGFSGDGGLASSAVLNFPNGLAFDSANNLYVADTNNNRIRRISPAGVISTFAGSADQGFAGDGGPATSARLALPRSLAFDGAGNLYFADQFNHRIRRVSPAGEITTYAGSGPSGFSQGAFAGDGGAPTSARLSEPSEIAIDAAGNLYIADWGNQRIRRVSGGVAPVLTSFATVPSGLQLSIGGVNYTTPTALPLTPGATVTISAPSPQGIAPRHTFRSWSDGGAQSHTITIGSAPATYTATFGAQFALSAAVSPLSSGSLVFSPTSSDGYYDAGTAVQITAVPDSAYSFLSFSGSLTATTNPATITINGAASVTANFGCNYTLAVTSAAVGAAAGSGTFSVTGGTGACASLPNPTSNAAFLTASVSGTTVTYQFTINPGAARSGVITIGARTFTVNQAGAALPSATDSGPISSSGANQTLTFRFSHPQGFSNLGVLNVLINRALDGGNACYIAYSQPAGILFLVKDGGPNDGLSDPLVLGSSATVSNSQCTVRGTGSSAVGSGNILTLTLNISFSASFTGSRVIYTAARDNASGNSGWKTIGASQIPEASPTFPRTGPMTPGTSTASNQTISVTFSDATSTANITTGWVLINTAVDAGQACCIAYFAPANLVFLYPDNGDGAQATTMVLTGTNTLENSQCRINSQGSSTSTSGGQLTLSLNITMKAPFSGPRGVWTAMQNATAQVSPWRISGAWLVP